MEYTRITIRVLDTRFCIVQCSDPVFALRIPLGSQSTPNHSLLFLTLHGQIQVPLFFSKMFGRVQCILKVIDCGCVN